MSEPKDIYRCQVNNCGFIYDPARGDKRRKIAPGIAFCDLPEDWHCPICKATKKSFKCMADEV